MTVRLREIAVPDFGLPIARPELDSETYAARCDELVARADADWVVVYADREHLANIAYLTGFEPRFEEALLLLDRNGRRIILAGNESHSYTAVSPLEGLQAVLSQTLSLMGQDRSIAPSLERILRECGLASGQSVALAGWKYMDASEWDGEEPAHFVPAVFVELLRKIIGSGSLSDCTAILSNPVDGMRSIIGADEIAQFEWGAARASAAVWRIVNGIRVGDTEYEAAARMGYAGEPMTCHMMLSSSNSSAPIIGLSSPSSRQIGSGDGVTTAVGYWGGLSCRAGLLTDGNDAFLDKAKGYFEGLCTWYETADIGVAGGLIHEKVEAALAPYGIRPALNPGHLVSIDEWSNSPIRPGSEDRLVSGMPFQVDIIPVPMLDGQALNCEDTVVLADEKLRSELEQRHPAVYARIEARRSFMADQLGVNLKPCILPLSSAPLCLPPFWATPRQLLTRR